MKLEYHQMNNESKFVTSCHSFKGSIYPNTIQSDDKDLKGRG